MLLVKQPYLGGLFEASVPGPRVLIVKLDEPISVRSCFVITLSHCA